MWTRFFSQLMLDVERWVWLQSQPQEEGGSYDGPTHAIIRVVSVGHSGCPTYWGEMEAKGRAEHWRVRMVLVRPRGEAPTWGRRKQPPSTSLPSRRTWEEKSRSCSPRFSETKGTCHHCGPNVPLLKGIPDFKSGCLCQSATSIAGFEMTVSTTWEWPAHLLRKFSRAHYYIPGGSQGDFTSLSWSYGPVVQDICCSAPVQIWITHCEDCVQPLGWWGTRPQNWNLHLTLTFLFSNHPHKHLQNSENYFSTKHDH